MAEQWLSGGLVDRDTFPGRVELHLSVDKVNAMVPGEALCLLYHGEEMPGGAMVLAAGQGAW